MNGRKRTIETRAESAKKLKTQQPAENLFNRLPDEALFNIFRFFPSQTTLQTAACVCKRFQWLAQDESLNDMPYPKLDYMKPISLKHKILRADNFESAPVAILPNRLVTGSREKIIKIWNTKTGQCEKILGQSNCVKNFVVLPNGLLAGGFDDGTIKIWDTKTWECIKTLINTLINQNYVDALAHVLPDLLISAFDAKLMLWDINTWQCKQIIDMHEGYVIAFATLPNGLLAVTKSYDRFRSRAEIWDTKTWARVKILTQSRAESLAVLPNGFLASGSSLYNTIKIWDVQTGACVQTLLHDDSILNYNYSLCALTVLPNGYLASASNRKLNIWNLSTGACRTLKAKMEVQDLAVLSDGRLCCAGDQFEIFSFKQIKETLELNDTPSLKAR